MTTPLRPAQGWWGRWLVAGAVAGVVAVAAGTVHAADVQASRSSELLGWLQQAYDAVRDRLATDRDREAKAWLMQQKQKAEAEAIKACGNAVHLRAQIACIEQRSNAFAARYAKRAAPEELRFAVLAELQSRLARATPKPADDGTALVQRVTARCSSNAVPRGEQAQCLQHAQDCLRIAATDRAASTRCLQALAQLIDTAATAGATPPRGPKGGECAVFDDPAQSDALAQREPERHLKLLMECQ